MHAFFTHSIIMDLDRIISLILKWCDVCTLSKGTVRPKIPSAPLLGICWGKTLKRQLKGRVCTIFLKTARMINGGDFFFAQRLAF